MSLLLQVCELRVMISALQDALVSSKRTYDQLRCRLDPDVSAGMMTMTTQGSVTSKPVCASQPPSHPPTTKSRVPSACTTDSCSVNAPASSFHPHKLYSLSANDGSLTSVSDNCGDACANKLDANCSAAHPIDSYSSVSKSEGSLPPDDDVHLAPHECDQETHHHHQSNTSAFTPPDVLSSCGGSDTFEQRTSHQGGKYPSVMNPSQLMAKTVSSSTNHVDSLVHTERPQSKCQSGQVYDV